MLEIKNLNAYYSNIQVLFGIDLVIEESDIAVVVGANGAGKTTLLKSIMNIEVSKTGSIKFRGVDITNMPTYSIARIGLHYIPDYTGLVPGLTLLENFYLARGGRNIDLEKLENLYPDLPKLLNRRVDVLSGGERKISAILRALLTNPKMLLLDEPTEGVAPIMVERIIDLMKRISREEKITILWTEPGAKLKKILKIANKVIVMRLGRIEYIGTSEEAERDIDKIKRLVFV